MAKPRYLNEVHALAASALLHDGRRTGPATVEWDLSGRCQTPVVIEHHARPDLKNGRDQAIIPGDTRTAFRVIMTYPCRECSPCLNHRAYKWRERATTEYSFARRTWMATLTFRPEEWWWIMTESRKRLGLNDLDSYPEKEIVREYDRTIYTRLQKYLKRIRKNSGAPLRFMAVCEQHKSGRLHYHVLIHEMSEDPVKYSVLRKAWTWGHSHHKLVPDTKAATYVCKYLSKSMLARVRASKRYGTPLGVVNEDAQDETNVTTLTPNDQIKDQLEV